MRHSVGYTLIVLAFMGGIAFGFWAKGWLNEDACIDAGGAWDYRTGSCRAE